jgi:sigma-B regulation protein RsbU (phosphoserine phosphatase)
MSSAPTPLAHLRHDLRTPINQILGYSELLLEEASDAGHAAAYGDDLQKIRHAAKQLLSLINQNLTDERVSLHAAPLAAGSGTAAPFAFSRGTDPGSAGFQPASSVPAPAAPALDVAALLAASADEASADAPAAEPGRILVVDDDPANRDVLSRQLARQGHTVAAAEHGEAAIARLRTEPFDLVLLDMMMPVLDGFSTLRALKGDRALRHLPVIMISALDELAAVVKCIEHGAEDFLPKPFNPTLLRARIGAGLQKKRFRDQEAAYLRTIEETQTRLRAELTEAENYIRSLLPAPGLCRTVSVDWRLVPSTELGGDSFGYHWIDDDHFALYLLDVCGHGVGAALLSAAAINVLRGSSLPGVDFRDPGLVLASLNNAFLMERQNEMYFTLWYGVWQASTRTLRFAAGGHPPALLVPGSAGFQPASDAPAEPLAGAGMVIGGLEGMFYKTFTRHIPGPARLYLLSDGVYEITRADTGDMWSLDELREFLGRPRAADTNDLDSLHAQVRALHGPGPLDDDFTIVRFDL